MRLPSVATSALAVAAVVLAVAVSAAGKLRSGRAPTGTVVTVHPGTRVTGRTLTERLAVGLAPGRYVWMVVAAEGDAVCSASVATLIID